MRRLESGFQARVLSAVAAALAQSNRTHAQELRDRAVKEADALPSWRKIEALLQIAQDCTGWDDAECKSIINGAIQLSRSENNTVILGRTLARAAFILFTMKEEKKATALLLESCQCLTTPSADETQIEEIVKACEIGPSRLVGAVAIRVVRAITLSSSFWPDFSGICAWLDSILLLFLQAAGERCSGMSGELLEELERAATLSDQVFLG